MKRSFRAFLAALLIAVPMLASCNEANNPIAPAATIERQDGLLDLVGGVVGGLVLLLRGRILLLRLIGFLRRALIVLVSLSLVGRLVGLFVLRGRVVLRRVGITA